GPATAHRGAVRVLRPSPDGRALATVDQAGDLRLWRLPDGRVLLPPTPTLRFAFNVAGTLVAVSPDGWVPCWGSRSGALISHRRLVSVATARKSWLHDIGASVATFSSYCPDGYAATLDRHATRAAFRASGGSIEAVHLATGRASGLPVLTQAATRLI